jgi:hypothetical protein
VEPDHDSLWSYPITVLYEQFGMDEIATVTWISLGSYTAAGMTSGVCVALAGER